RRMLSYVLMRAPQRSTRFPYTTLFRSRACAGAIERLRLIQALSKALEQTELARDELRHRVKNAFVSAQAIGRLSMPPEYAGPFRSEEHTSELQSRENLVCRLLLEKKKK